VVKIEINNKLEVQWAELVSLTCHFVLGKVYTEPSMGASYQISINLGQMVVEKMFFNRSITNKNCL
jgi:hypothetical protein